MDRPSLASKLILALAILAGVSFLAANRFALQRFSLRPGLVAAARLVLFGEF